MTTYQASDYTLITEIDWKPGDHLIQNDGSEHLVTRVQMLPIGPIPWTVPVTTP